MTAESSSPQPQDTLAAESTQPAPRRRRKVLSRLALLVASLFAALAVLSGGAGLILGTAASVGVEHGHDGSSLHEEGGGDFGPLPGAPNR